MRRNIITVAFFICLLVTNFTVASAGVVRVADVGVKTFVSEMRSLVNRNTTFFSITINDAFRASNLDKNNPNYYGYGCRIIDKETGKPAATLSLYANGEGYLSKINMLSPPVDSAADLEKACTTGKIFSVMLVALGVTTDDNIDQFINSINNKVFQELKNDNVTYINVRESIYCRAKKRYFDVHIYYCNENHQHIEISSHI